MVVAIRRWTLWGWGVEADMQVRVVRREPPPESDRSAAATRMRAVEERRRFVMAEHLRRDLELRWLMLGAR